MEKNAFPVLIAHLDDETVAADRFRGEIIGSAANPTVGAACFEMLQYQLEGCWPKAYRQHYKLTKENIRQWLADRGNKSLSDLRIECARTSLDAATSLHREHQSKYSESLLSFFTENLDKVLAETNDAG